MEKVVTIGCVVHKDGGGTLEVMVAGRHVDGSANQISDFLVRAIEEHKPRHLIVNFAKFDYTFGDDIGGALLRGLVTLKKHGGVLACRVVARENTARSLRSLLDVARWDVAMPVSFFEDVDSALVDVRAV